MLRKCAYGSLLAMFLSLPALAAEGGEDRLVREYRDFAGSTENAESLVQGLRDDTAVQLVSPGGTRTTFTSPTGKMGLGNVDIALSLAKATLADQGISDPSPAQIKAALNGGTVINSLGEQVKLPGVLELRASGMGWGAIAQRFGFKLGELMRAQPHRSDGKVPDRGAVQRARLDPPQRPQGFEPPERPHKFDRPERPERPEHPHRR